MDRMKQLNQKLEPPDPQFLWIASDVQLSQMPFKIPTIVWIHGATEQLLIIIALILQLELTRSWNHISGLANLEYADQLVPFVLGAGGLIRVLGCNGLSLGEASRRSRY